MRILVIGAGAVGGYFGGRLMQAGRDVSFLVRPQKAESLRARGLQIISPYGDVTLQPKLVLASELQAPWDVILLSVKAYALQNAMRDFAAAVGPGTLIVPVLNGMRHMDRLAAQFGDALVGGVCMVATDVNKEGAIVQLSGMQSLTYGELRGGSSDRVGALHTALDGAGFEARISENIVQEMWQKWVMLATVGAVTCGLRGNIGEIEAQPGGAQLALNILAEVASIVAACGHTVPEDFLTRMRAMITERGSGLASSMYRDLNKGARVEVDEILGDLLERGRSQGIVAPLLEMAFVSLRIYQNRLAHV